MEIRGNKILGAVRGMEAVDLDSLVQCLMAMGKIGMAHEGNSGDRRKPIDCKGKQSYRRGCPCDPERRSRVYLNPSPKASRKMSIRTEWSRHFLLKGALDLLPPLLSNFKRFNMGHCHELSEAEAGGSKTVVFLHQCHGWKKARRFVAIRKLVAVQTEGVFFPMPQYEFFCYVTNLPMLLGIFISCMVREPPVKTGSPGARARWPPAPSAPASSGPIPPFSRAASWHTT